MSTHWSRDSLGRRTGRDWSDWIDRTDKSIDPYLVWADVTGGSGFAAKDEVDDKAQNRWPFIIELSREGIPALYEKPPIHDDVPVIFGCIQIPGVYKVVDPGQPNRWIIEGRYVTALVHPEDIWHLMHSEVIVRAQLGLPRIRSVNEPRAIRLPDPGGGGKERIVVGLIDDGFAFAHERLLDSEGKSRVRYLWDQDVRREDPSWIPKGWVKPSYLGYGAELGPDEIDRVAAPSGDQWAPYRAVGYGRYRLDPETQSTAPLDADMLAIPVESMVASSHGHSVADLAAGFPPRYPGQTELLPASLAQSSRRYEAARQDVDNVTEKIASLAAQETISDEDIVHLDSADQWSIVCVQLPIRTIADTSGGSLGVHVLDGIRYILEKARRLPYRDSVDTEPMYASNRVVINVSYGATAGGHDGTSILEKAIVDIVKNPRLTETKIWAVLAAGNAANDSAHSSTEMIPGGDVSVLCWQVGPDNPLESYLEIWLPDRDVFGHLVPIETLRRIRIDVQSPGGEQLIYAKVGDVWQLRSKRLGEPHDPIAAVIYAPRVVQSEHGTMILIATAPTRRTGAGRPVAPHGEWIVTLSWDPGAQSSGPRVRVHAWSERSDLLFETSRGQQTHVFSDEPTSHQSEFDPDELAQLKGSQLLGSEAPGAGSSWFRHTLSSLASTSPARKQFARAGSDFGLGEVVVVGAHRKTDGEISQVSGGGPSRLASMKDQWNQIESRGGIPNAIRSAPDVTAPGEISPAVPGLRTSGLQSTSLGRISATSAAAALVTRAIANVQYVQVEWGLKLGGIPERKTAAAEKILFDDRARESEMDDARPTLTPRLDDAFRRGRVRVR